MVITTLLATLTRDDKASNRSNVPDNNSNNSADPSLISSYANGDLIQFSDASFNKQKFDDVVMNLPHITSPIKTFSKKSVNEQIIEFRNFHNIMIRKTSPLQKMILVVKTSFKIAHGNIWPPNTCLIVGDSIVNGLMEEKMSKNRLIKVRSFSGALIEDFYPSRLIIHAGTNNALHSDSDFIMEQLMQLKHHLKEFHPNCEVFFSCPIIRTEHHAARITINNLRNKFSELDVPVLLNKNIDVDCLGVMGLHLNKTFTGKLAVNFISLNRKH